MAQKRTKRMETAPEVIDVEPSPPTSLAVLPQRQAAGLELWEPEHLRSMITREIELREIMLEYMRGQMKRGQHYYTRQDFGRRDGEEPQGGDDKPSLKKEGALNLCHLLHCRPVVAHRDETFHEDGHYTVTTTVHLISLRTGEIVGEGEGLCTTHESKYAWRWLFGSQLPEDQGVGLVTKSIKPKRGPNKGKWVTLYRVPNMSLADLFNTVLKLSYKRGLVAGVLTLPLASELFTQDQEDFDLDDEHGEGDEGGEQPTTVTPQARRERLERAAHGTSAASATAAGSAPPQGAQGPGEPTWTAEQVQKMASSDLNKALGQRLRYLAPGSKEDREGYIRLAFGDAASTWGEAEPLGLSVRKAALSKLLAIRKETPPPVEEDEDDVPLGDDPLTGQDTGAPAPAEGTQGPPPGQFGAAGYITEGAVAALRSWAASAQVAGALEELLRVYPLAAGLPVVNEAQYGRVITALQAAARELQAERAEADAADVPF